MWFILYLELVVFMTLSSGQDIFDRQTCSTGNCFQREITKRLEKVEKMVTQQSSETLIHELLNRIENLEEIVKQQKQTEEKLVKDVELLNDTITLLQSQYINTPLPKEPSSTGESLPTVSTNTSKDHTGSSFWIAFPTVSTYSERRYVKIILSIVSNTPLSLTIRTLNNTSHYMTDPLNPTLGLPNTLIQDYNTIEHKGILVTTNDSASVYTASSRNSYYADMSWIPPSDSLGTFYVAVSYHPYSFLYYNYISIASLNADTTVNITINTAGTFTFNSLTYGNGDILSLHLNTFSSVQVSCTKDITGSEIRSSQPIVVQSGITTYAFKMGDSGCESAASVYLPPVSAWGKTFVVPPIQTALRYAVRIVPSILGTTLSLTSNSMVNSYVLTSRLELEFIASEVLLIECNNPCFVSQYPASESKDNYGVTSYMVTVPAVEQFSRDYRIHSPNFPPFKSHFLSVMIKSDEADGLLLNGTNVNSYNMALENVKHSQIKWTVLSINVTEGTHTVSHTSLNAVYGVINYGFGHCRSYGYVAGLNI